MADVKPLTELPEHSLCFSTETCSVRIDDATEEVEQTYLKLRGTPEGFRWLAKHLEGLANSGEKHENGAGNVVAPRDFNNRPIKMEGWDSFEFFCQPEASTERPSD